MNNFLNTFKNSVHSFAKEEEGAQVVEYALIIAVVSIALVLVLSNSTTGISNKFSAFVTRIGNCLSGSTGC